MLLIDGTKLVEITNFKTNVLSSVGENEYYFHIYNDVTQRHLYLDIIAFSWFFNQLYLDTLYLELKYVLIKND